MTGALIDDVMQSPSQWWIMHPAWVMLNLFQHLAGWSDPETPLPPFAGRAG